MTQPRNIPSAIGVPGGAPMDLQSVAAYLTQLSVGLNNWIYQAATTINALVGGAVFPQSAPPTPKTGWVLYADSGDGNKLKAKAYTGTVVTLGTP